MEKIDFPVPKTFKEEVLDIAKSWADQEKCTLAEATEIILRFARENHQEALQEALNE